MTQRRSHGVGKRRGKQGGPASTTGRGRVVGILMAGALGIGCSADAVDGVSQSDQALVNCDGLPDYFEGTTAQDVKNVGNKYHCIVPGWCSQAAWAYEPGVGMYWETAWQLVDQCDAGGGATCSDGVQNQGETGVDCGGPCSACASCSDGVQNQGETGVDCGGPCTACGTGGPSASVYQHCWFNTNDPTGYSASLGEGSYTLGDLQANGIVDNDLSSVQVPSGYQVVLFEHDNFGGASLTLTEEEDCLTAFPLGGGNWNDKVTSMQILPLGPGLGSTVQAESGAQTGTQLENGGATVGYFDAGDHMAFANVNMNDVTGLDMLVGGEVTGGVMEVRLDSPTGTLLGSYTMTATGGWQVYQNRSMSFSTTATGVHTLYLVGASGSGILNIDHFTLTGGGGCSPSTETCDGADNDCDGQVDEGGVCGCQPSTEICDGADNDCDGQVDEGACSGSNVVPLFDSGTALEPYLQEDTPTALITHAADRGRDRHAREWVFEAYEHFLSWYWEDRTIEIMITDTIGKGGNTIRLDVKSLHKLNAREGRMFFMGLHTAAEYCDNSPIQPTTSFGGAYMDMGVYNGMNPDQPFTYAKTIHQYMAPLTCAPSSLAVGQLIEIEISQFLDSPNNGRSNYYGTTFLYKVGHGFVPWEATGAQHTPHQSTDCISFPQSPDGACGSMQVAEEIPASRRLGGDTTTHRMESGEPDNLFLEMATNLAPQNAQPFMLGRRLLHSSAIDGVHDEKPFENPAHPSMQNLAGPNFINESCQSCHVRNTRAVPPGVGGDLSKWVFKLADSSGNPHPLAGRVFQPAGSLSEGNVTLGNWINHANGLRSPTFNFSGSIFNGTPPSNFSPRISPALVGLGLLEAIEEYDILALEDPTDANGDGISGRAHIVEEVVPGGSPITRLGRFGWKAGQPTLRQQIAAAFNTDMGVSSSVFPNPDCGSSQSGCSGSSQEISNADLDMVTLYVALLGVRPQDEYSGNGAAIFQNVGCANCHVDTFVTSPYAKHAELRNQTIHPYTDLLLHDMGSGLADSMSEGSASNQEWRTPPLWSIGKIDDTHAYDGGEQQAFMHDGRARTLDEAIRWHGGEGEASKNAYMALSQSEKDQLIAFLNSL